MYLGQAPVRRLWITDEYYRLVSHLNRWRHKRCPPPLVMIMVMLVVLVTQVIRAPRI